MIYCKLLVLTRVNLVWINGRGIQYNILKIQRSKLFLSLQIHAENTLIVSKRIKLSSNENGVHLSRSWLSHSCSARRVRVVTNSSSAILCVWRGKIAVASRARNLITVAYSMLRYIIADVFISPAGQPIGRKHEKHFSLPILYLNTIL